MSRGADVTYQDFTSACTEMTANNEKITLRSIQQRLGGSLSTISSHRQKYLREMEQANKIDSDLSDNLRMAIKAEIARTMENTKQKYETLLAGERIQSKELQEVLSQQETTIDTMETQYAAFKHSVEKLKLNFEKELSVAQALVAESLKREKSLQEELNTLREKLHAAEVKVAVAEARIHDFTKQNERTEKRNKTKSETLSP